MARALWGQLTGMWPCSEPQLVLDRSSREGRTGWVVRSQPWEICPEEQGGERCPRVGWGCGRRILKGSGQGFPKVTVDKESACQCRRHNRHGFSPWVGKIPWSRKGQPGKFLPGKSHGQRSLVGYSPWGHKELDMTANAS